MKSITVCVEYDDLLAMVLPHNSTLFERTLVVTSYADTRTQELAEQCGCDWYATDVFYEGGASFNKGAAMEEGFSVLGRDGWIVIWDADILMPSDITVHNADRDCLYTPVRHLLEDPTRINEFSVPELWESLPSPTYPNEFSGYFQLFHADAVAPPWYTTSWSHAGGCDSDFQYKFPQDRCLRPPYSVLHLGPEGMPELKTRVGRNWCGRVSPRIDTRTTSASASSRRDAVRQLVRNRAVGNMASEKVSTIPRTMAFFWDGRMSWLRWLTLKTFRMHNPDWEILLYSAPCAEKRWQSGEDSDTDYTGYDYRKKLDEVGVTRCTWEPPVHNLAPAQACDMWEWWRLGHHGGFVADMDILWMKPLDQLRRELAGNDAVFCLESGWLAIGFFATTEGCVLFREAYERARSEHGVNYQHYGTELLYRMAGVSPCPPAPGQKAVQAFMRRFPGQKMSIVPDHIVYPYDWRQIDNIWIANEPVNELALALHWFGGAEVSRQFGHKMTPGNWRRVRNTLRNYLERIL